MHSIESHWNKVIFPPLNIAHFDLFRTQSQSKSDDDGSHHENGPACKSSEDIENGARMNHVESSPNPP